jgi:integrase
MVGAGGELRLDDVYRQFLEAQYRPSTVAVYWRATANFVHWMRMHGMPVTIEGVTRYLSTVPAGARPLHAYAIKSYLGFMGFEQVARQVPVPRGSYIRIRPQMWFPYPLIKYMVEHTSSARLAAMIAVAYDLALRREELRRLNRAQLENEPYVDVGTGRAIVYRMKTRQYPWQQLQLSRWAITYLRRYLDSRADGGPALFAGPDGQRLSPSAIDAFIRGRLRDEFGVPGVSMKAFRHSRLTWMAVEGHSLIDIAKWAGHSTPNPTLVYIHAAERFRMNPLASIEFLKGTPIYPTAVRLLEDYASHA